MVFLFLAETGVADPYLYLLFLRQNLLRQGFQLVYYADSQGKSSNHGLKANSKEEANQTLLTTSSLNLAVNTTKGTPPPSKRRESSSRMAQRMELDSLGSRTARM